MPIDPNPRLVSVPELRRRTSLSTATIYRLIADGSLARPSRISPNRVAWSSDYIDAWLAARLRAAA